MFDSLGGLRNSVEVRGRLGREALGTGGSSDFVLCFGVWWSWGVLSVWIVFGFGVGFCGWVWFWIVLWITELVLGCKLCLADLQRSIFLGWLRNSEWCESVGGGY